MRDPGCVFCAVVEALGRDDTCPAGEPGQVLRKVVARRRAGVVEPRDLPPECWSAAKRVLGPLESLECDAIVEALLDTGGSKAEAARRLANPQPVHTLLLIEHGVYLLESLDLEGLAAAGVHEFLFVALPLAIRGATGSMIDPVAIV